MSLQALNAAKHVSTWPVSVVLWNVNHDATAIYRWYSTVHRVQYWVWSRLLCNVPLFDPKHKLVWIDQFANIGTRIPGKSGNTSTIGAISDAKATWNNLNFPNALSAKKSFKHILVWTTLIRNPANLPIQTKNCTRCSVKIVIHIEVEGTQYPSHTNLA